MPAASEDSPRYPGWRVVAASSACIFVSFASLLVYTFGIFLKPLTKEFGWSREAVSAAFGFAAIAVAVCSPVLGWLLDRFPARRIILPCMAVFGTSFASLSLLRAPIWHLYAIFLLLGIVGNGTAHLAYSRALSTWFDKRRGTAFAALLGGGAAGAMVLPLAAQYLIGNFGWRTSFALLGLLVLALGLPLGWRVRERVQSSRQEKRLESGASVPQALRSRAYWIILAMLFFCSLSQNGALEHISALLTDRGVSPASAALAASALGGATLASRLVTGWLLDRYFAPRVALVLLLIAAAGTFALAHAHSAFAGIFGAALIGIGMGGEADVTPYLLTRYFGLRSFSSLYGWSWTVYAIAGALGPILMSRAFDRTGSYTKLLLLLAALSSAAALLMLLLPRYQRPAQSDPLDALPTVALAE
ncbi:MAG TPA: MFS transporter [Bryobacteraceae bacterium]|jgi:predicted MFS family arabinose efflux permease|nr:MFS transporter [Bryobacteraceae bacterium]